MGLLSLPRIPRGASAEETANIANMVFEELEYRLNGFIQTNNVQEIGDWYAKKNLLVSKDGDVGMSTEDTGTDDVRFFAGGTDKGNAPWRVYKSGKGVATGWKIQSSESGYPRVELSTEADTVGVYFAEDKYILLKASTADDTPVIELINGSHGATIMMADSTFSIQVDGNMIFANEGDIYLTTTGKVTFDSWDSIVDGSSDGPQSLQNTLNGKAKIASYNGGIPVGTVLAVDGGGTVTWGGINLT